MISLDSRCSMNQGRNEEELSVASLWLASWRGQLSSCRRRHRRLLVLRAWGGPLLLIYRRRHGLAGLRDRGRTLLLIEGGRGRSGHARRESERCGRCGRLATASINRTWIAWWQADGARRNDEEHFSIFCVGGVASGQVSGAGYRCRPGITADRPGFIGLDKA